MPQNITINGYNLQDSQVFTEHIQTESIEIDEAKTKIPHRDGEKLTSYTYATRKIIVDGKIVTTSASGLDGKIDDMKANLIGAMGLNMDIDYAGTTRRFVVNVKNFIVTREAYNTTLAPYSLEVEAINPPFGMSLTAVSGYASATVSGTFSITTSGIFSSGSFTALGTANPTPQIVFTVNVPGTLRSIQFTNTTTNTSLNVQLSSPVAGDKIVIDTGAFTVKKNGATLTTYSGTFPMFYDGLNNFSFTAFGTKPDFTYGLSVEYNSKFL